MRMNQKGELTAKKIINSYDEKKLTSIFREYGELDNAFRLSKLISEARLNGSIETTAQLKEIIKWLKQGRSFTELDPGSHFPVKPGKECSCDKKEEQSGKEQEI